jgi:hypothetical protein
MQFSTEVKTFTSRTPDERATSGVRGSRKEPRVRVDGGLRIAMRAGVGMAVVVLSTLIVGCVSASDEGAATVNATPAEAREESLTQTVSGVVSGTGQTVGVCAPLTCCFPTGAEWSDNPFENGLRALGCTTPQAYTERYGSTGWWLFTRCHQSPALTALVLQYSSVAPYDSRLAANECLYLNQGNLLASDVFVEFDPTCSSCRPAVAR